MLNDLRNKTAVIAGNGMSLSALKTGIVLNTDFIVRINNFFFEPKYYLGSRVDLAYMGGDPRVSPFMFETLYRVRNDYELHAWTSHNPRVIRAGMRRFKDIYRPLQFKDQHIETIINELQKKYQRRPITGSYAILAAHALGVSKIILVGMDYYSQKQRYPYKVGPRYRSLMGQDINQRQVDIHLHNQRLDAEVIEALQKRGDVEILAGTTAENLSEIMDHASIREGNPILIQPHKAPTDWASRVGIYPIYLLKIMRYSSRILRKITNAPPRQL